MITLIFRRSSDPRICSYLLGERDGAGHPRVADPVILFGEPHRFSHELATTNHYAQQYLSLALSWSEDLGALGVEAVTAATHEMLKLFLGDQPFDNLGVLAVLHERRRGTDVHLAINKRHRLVGLQFPLYCHSSPQQKRGLRNLRRKLNLTNNWSDPDDPWRKGVRATPHRYLSGEMKEEHRKIDNWALDWIADGRIESRDELVSCFQDAGYQVAAHDGHLSLSIFNPQITDEEKIQHLEFHGGKYRANANYGELISRLRSPRSRGSEATRAEIARLDSELRAYRSARARKAFKRFPAYGFRIPTLHQEFINQAPDGLLHFLAVSAASFVPSDSPSDPSQGYNVFEAPAQSEGNDHTVAPDSVTEPFGQNHSPLGGVNGPAELSETDRGASADAGSIRGDEAGSDLPEGTTSDARKGHRRRDLGKDETSAGNSGGKWTHLGATITSPDSGVIVTPSTVSPPLERLDALIKKLKDTKRHTQVVQPTTEPPPSPRPFPKGPDANSHGQEVSP